MIADTDNHRIARSARHAKNEEASSRSRMCYVYTAFMIICYVCFLYVCVVFVLCLCYVFFMSGVAKSDQKLKEYCPNTILD